MYIHKYVEGSMSIYLVKENANKPTNILLSGKNWKGSTTQNTVNALRYLGELTGFKKEDQSPESEKVQPGMQKDVEAMVEQLDKVATGLQADGNLDLAKAVDWISDIIENKVQ